MTSLANMSAAHSNVQLVVLPHDSKHFFVQHFAGWSAGQHGTITTQASPCANHRTVFHIPINCNSLTGHNVHIILSCRFKCIELKAFARCINNKCSHSCKHLWCQFI